MTNGYRIVPDTGELASTISRRLQLIYKEKFSEFMVNKILALVSKHYSPRQHWDEKEIVMILYGDTFIHPGEFPLATLHRFVKTYFSDFISSIHILPFFPFTSDDGFAVCDYYSVNPKLGSWKDIEDIGHDFSLMGDLVINHVSSKHPWFIQFLNYQSPGRNYFITRETEEEDYRLVVRPRSTPLFTGFNTSEGTKYVWTTFSSDQVDLNFGNPEVLLEIVRIMIFYISKGIRLIRLDAIAYLWKCHGTNCLHLHETHEIVKLLREIAEFVCPGTIILTETNVPNKENWSYFGNSDEAHMVYQFSLPPLLLHALFSGNSGYLSDWADQIPEVGENQTFLNYTASHDGIGVRPLEGLLPAEEIAVLIEGMVAFGGLVSMKTNSDGSLSPYEINITYYDAMKGTIKGADHLHHKRFICSQTIMMSLKGIPAFYIHSMLATENDIEGVKSTGRARSINRKKLDYSSASRNLETDTVSRNVYEELTGIISIRRAHQAFHPASKQKILRSNDKIFAFIRESNEGENVVCISNITDQDFEIRTSDYSIEKGYDLLSDSLFSGTNHILIESYQTMWIVKAEIL